MTNLALWKKSIIEARWLLASSVALMFVAHWLRVWVSSFFGLSDLEKMLGFMPDVVEKLSPVPFSQIATSAGKIAPAYDDPIVLLLVTVWGISRGSDAVSGELNRGTMEMVLAQPVTRVGVLWTQAAVTVLGAALLGLTAWAGTSAGLAMITLEEAIEPSVFIPPALNLFAMTVFLAGLSTMVSAGSTYRARTIGIVGGFYAVSMIAKIVSRAVESWSWLGYFSFFTPFEPQVLVTNSEVAWSVWLPLGTHSFELGGLGYDGILIGLGLTCYAAATVVFCRRDLPAPL